MGIDNGSRVVLVAGASSGIGAACVNLFSAKGWDVIGLSRSAQMLKGPRATTYLSCDLTRMNDVERAVERSLEKHHRFSAVVHCVGDIYDARSIDEITWDRWSASYDVCVGTAARLVQATLETMKQSRGAYTFISSVAAEKAYPGIADYCAAKAALQSLSRSLSLELADSGARSNCIAPAAVDTPLLRKAEFTVEEAASWHKLGRVGEPWEIAEMAYFLASEKSKWITGQTFTLDGGLLL